MTLLETLVGPVGYALLAGLGAGLLALIVSSGILLGASKLPRITRPIPFFIAGLSIGVMLGFWLGVMV